MFKHNLWRMFAPSAIIFSVALHSMAQTPTPPDPAPNLAPAPGSINFAVKSSNERMEMNVHSSRIITVGQKIPQAQVNNPDILELTPLSPTQVQVSAKTAGVTQINLWGEDQKLFTIDVIVYGDAQELKMLLRSQFPNAALTVIPVAGSVLISGFVDKPEHIDRIIRIAEEYYPKVINNMTVGGVQTVLLHVKVMEVSRTKLRRLGFDWAKITGANVITSGTSGFLSDANPSQAIGYLPGGLTKAAFRSVNPSTFAFSVVNGTSSAFYGVLDALRQDDLLKLMTEPTLVTESGRPALFNSGGLVAYPEPQGLGSIAVAYKEYGTKVDFVPIVLGNGKIRLEVRPDITELDYSNGTTIQGTSVPGFTERKADTAVELVAGQTLAIAGLVESRIEAETSGLPWIGDVPYLGAAFRKVHETANEVELLILVTPELVDAMDACEVPPCGPGMETTSPTDWELYMKGHLEVPNCCPAGGGEGGMPCNGSPTPVPDDGLIGPEQISTPPSSGAGNGTSRSGGQNTPAMAGPANVARRGGGSSAPYSRYTSSKPNNPSGNSSSGTSNGPPGFIGPVGYDVVK
ncbi:MAG: pilus assembly protein N-terminal domain-containing protein [Thermoguttaceae bacterium]|jgi:pilus assembly protein CpaC